MLCDVASLVVDFLGAKDLKNLTLVQKSILNGPPGKYTRAKANNLIPCPGSLHEFFSYIKLRNPNLYRLQESISNLKDITHLHLVFEYPHVLDTSNQRINLQAACPLLTLLTLEGPQKFCNQLIAALDVHTLCIQTFLTLDPISKSGEYDESSYNHHNEFIITHENIH
jgi:hypothetical protein